MHSIHKLTKIISTSRCGRAAKNNLNNLIFCSLFSTRKPKKPHKTQYYYLDMEPEKSLHPPSPPQEHKDHGPPTGDEKVENLPETKKSKMKLVVTRAELDSIKENRKLRISDLIRIAPKTQLDVGQWPFELVLVRHGQSEGNEAVSRSEHGDLSAYTPEFKAKHSSTYRLTDKGIAQAKVTGEWVRSNIGDSFDRYYTSEYVRAMETASLLQLPNAHWYTEIVLRERDKGLMDNTSAVDKQTKFAEEMTRRKRDAFFWAPPAGESLANVCVRIDHTLNTLRRECSNQRVIIVCHGEVMWAFRVRLERLSQIKFHQLTKSDDPKDKIHNTTVLHYTRIHPKTGEVYPYFKFLRSVCPWKPEFSWDGWMEFDRPMYSNEELMESVSNVPRYVNNTPKDVDFKSDEKVNY
jgi:NAD+ kinase